MGIRRMRRALALAKRVLGIHPGDSSFLGPVGGLMVPVLTVAAVVNLRSGLLFNFIVGLFSIIFAVVITGLRADIAGWRRGFTKGLGEATNIAEFAVTQTFLAQAALARLGPACEICGLTENPMDVALEPGPGNPPMYFNISVRCKTGGDGDHADLKKYPATQVLTTSDFSAEGES